MKGGTGLGHVPDPAAKHLVQPTPVLIPLIGFPCGNDKEPHASARQLLGGQMFGTRHSRILHLALSFEPAMGL